MSSEEKRRFLQATYGIPDERIFSSRHEDFAHHLLAATQGHSVDVIINSLSGDLLHTTWESCLAEFGRLVEIGKRDLLNHARLNMDVISKNVSYSSLDLTLVLRQRPKLAARLH